MNLPKKDWSNVKEQRDLVYPTPGGYVCKITAVEDVPDRKYLYVEFDIAEGDYKNNFTERYKNYGNWPATGKAYLSYKSAEIMSYNFDPFIAAVQNSNVGYSFNEEDETTLKGKWVGVILGEEEYVDKRDNVIKTSLKARGFRSVSVIRDGRFRMPKIKELSEEKKAEVLGFSSPDEDDSDLPSWL